MAQTCPGRATLALGCAALIATALQKHRLFAIAAYIVMVNAACAIATWNLLRGKRVTSWSTGRDRIGQAGMRP